MFMHGVAVMIIKDRRIEELAHQDGCRSLLRERFVANEAMHKVPSALAIVARRE